MSEPASSNPPRPDDARLAEIEARLCIGKTTGRDAGNIRWLLAALRAEQERAQEAEMSARKLAQELQRTGDSARQTIKDALVLKEAAEAEVATLREALERIGRCQSFRRARELAREALARSGEQEISAPAKPSRDAPPASELHPKVLEWVREHNPGSLRSEDREPPAEPSRRGGA